MTWNRQTVTGWGRVLKAESEVARPERAAFLADLAAEGPALGNRRSYGDTAITLAHGVSGGTFQGRPFRESERVSCVFVRQHDGWKCVLTHLSRLPAPGTGTSRSTGAEVDSRSPPDPP